MTTNRDDPASEGYGAVVNARVESTGIPSSTNTNTRGEKAANEISDFERKRLVNIAQRDKLLKQLAVDASLASLSPGQKPKPTKPTHHLQEQPAPKIPRGYNEIEEDKKSVIGKLRSMDELQRSTGPANSTPATKGPQQRVTKDDNSDGLVDSDGLGVSDNLSVVEEAFGGEIESSAEV
ncbi:MAG: hypothetical protein Q9221_000689 [Calogaya cf. arnoldii]